MSNFGFSKINIYLAKDFLLNFIQILAIFSLLIFFINLMDSLDKARSSGASSIIAVEMAFLQISSFISDIVSSLVLIAAIITFIKLSMRSEITIIRISGYSLWRIIRPISFTAFLLGLFWIFVFGPLSIKMAQAFDDLEREHINKLMREVIILKNGIWLKQNNIDKVGEEIVLQARTVYDDTEIELKNVKFLFYDNDGVYYERIDAKSAYLKDGFWELKDIILNDQDNINSKVDSLQIKTDVKYDFVKQKIINNFQNVKLFSIFTLPFIIKSLEDSGFSSAKFTVYFYSLISKPLLFVAMTFIACFFGLNHIRSQKSSVMIFLGIITGLVVYIASEILQNLGASGIISNFAATWLVIIICLASGVLMIYKKEFS